ncbi:WD repeat-containing protein 70-like [Saccostrea cucullata]|uniref:WD repeat-containing protein 70-like n=1 Tax=Saccostrea cuccullata TaxID=36930 RepID=UPI002ED149D2
MTDKTNDGSKKKARTFDFMDMFKEARQTALERNQGKFEDDKHSTENDNEDIIGPPPPAAVAHKSAEETESSKTQISKNSKPSDKSSDEEDMIGPPLPPGIAKGSKKDTDDDDDMIGPPLPPGLSSSKDSDDEEDEEEEEETLDKKIPSSHEISLDHGSKAVSALALDPAGARLVTGGHDFIVKFWDFAGMDQSLQSFRNIKPCESHHIKQLQYSATGEMILIVAANSRAKVMDRDGFEKLECAKGDPYLVDMASTKGHTAMLNGGCWNPKMKEEFMTCSNDGTVRLWDVNTEGKKHKNCIKPKSQQGRKLVPTACTYSNDGRWVAAGCQDGSIQIWDHNKNFVNVALLNRGCHMNGTDTSCLCFSYDGQCLASRGGDDTLKLWDIRNFKKPLKVRENLVSYYPVTDCIFSPDDRMVLTGTSVKKQGDGKLIFMERESLNTVSEIAVNESSVVRCIWHPKLNQIVIGCSDGKARLFYDPDKSHRGAMLCMVKQPRKSKQVLAMASQQIITPYALPMFKENKTTSTKKFEEKVRKDPIKSKRPDLPITGPGEGGRIGMKGATLAQYVAQSLVKRKPDKYENDPRAAILRHAKEAAENPFWIDPAYKKTQPEKLFQEEEKEEEEDEDEPVWKKPKV